MCARTKTLRSRCTPFGAITIFTATMAAFFAKKLKIDLNSRTVFDYSFDSPEIAR